MEARSGAPRVVELNQGAPDEVEEQEQGVFDPAPRRAAVGNLEQRVHLGLAEPADRLRRCLLQCNRADIGAPPEMAGIAAGDEAREGANRRQALVASLHGAAAVLLEMGEELQHAPGREILHGEVVDRLAGPGADERQQKGEGAYGRGRDEDRPLLIGSVKTNIGRLELAAGVAGVIKTVVAMKRGLIPKHLHFRNPNPTMDWDRLPLQVTATPMAWPTRSERLPLAGVSGFG